VGHFSGYLSAQDSRRFHHRVGHALPAGELGMRRGASVLLGASTLAGVLTMALFRHQVSFGLPLSAGVTIYVAASDLMPEVNREPGVKMALVVFLGVGLLFLLDKLAHVH
jgi:ZIP family zinc transporter/zinc and cadmium transporter